MPCQRRCLRSHALHQVAVGDDAIGVMVDDLVPGPVVDLGQVGLGDRHTDAVAEPLPQRTRGRLDARCQPELRMAGGKAAPLAESLQLVKRQIVAGEVE